MNEILKKLNDCLPLTEEEVNIFLKTVCELIRKDCGIYDPMNTDCKVCDETSLKFGRLTTLKYKCDVNHIDIKKLLQIPLTHYSNIITFNVNNSKKVYLLDMTYSQFFGDSIVLDDKKQPVSTEKSFGKIKDEPFVKELRKNGYIELNEDIFMKYINAFLELCNVNNKKDIYNNLKELLSTEQINIIFKK